MHHVLAFLAVTNPLVNSYKRLIPGYEAPVNVAWSDFNRSPHACVPARRGLGPCIHVRVPDPSCNRYLAFLVMLAAGLDGIRHKIDSRSLVNVKIIYLKSAQKEKLRIQQLPVDLIETLHELEQSEMIKRALDVHIAKHFLRAMRLE